MRTSDGTEIDVEVVGIQGGGMLEVDDLDGTDGFDTEGIVDETVAVVAEVVDMEGVVTNVVDIDTEDILEGGAVSTSAERGRGLAPDEATVED